MTTLYKSGDGVRNINLTVNTGELVTLLGPSGCGKTTITAYHRRLPAVQFRLHTD
jgi:ABC-type Fe3+/spermidine/putrescine transport system ATPase subunit